MTFDRQLVSEPKRPEGDATWHEGSLEAVGDQILLSLHAWYGPEIFGSEHEPYLELAVRDAAGKSSPVKKLVPLAGLDEIREVLLTGAAAGSYESSVFLWGHNRVTNTQHNVSGPTLTISKP